MAIVTFASHAAIDTLTHERICALRDWLEGRWGAVFSHPEDFAPAPTTPQGYVTCIAAAVLDAEIKPIEFRESLEAQQSTWLDHAFNDDAVVLLSSDAADVVDLAEHALASKLEGMASMRFVLLIDPTGHVRLTMKYESSERPRLMIDIVHTVAALRSDKGTHGRQSLPATSDSHRRAV